MLQKEPSVGPPSADGVLTPNSKVEKLDATPSPQASSSPQNGLSVEEARLAEQQLLEAEEQRRRERADEERREMEVALAAARADRLAQLVSERTAKLAQQVASLETELGGLDLVVEQHTHLLAAREGDFAAHTSAKQRAEALLEERRAVVERRIERIELIQQALAGEDLESIEDAITELEGTFETCDSLDHIWKTALREDSVFAVLTDDLSTEQISALRSRIAQATLRHEVAVQGVEERLIRQDQCIKRAVEIKSSAIRRLQHEHQVETKLFEERRRQLKIHEGEQRFHERRGTFVKERNPHPHADELVKEQQRDKHTMLCANVIRSQDEVKLLFGQVQGIRKDIDNEKKEFEQRASRLKAQLRELSTSAETAGSNRSALEKESAELKEVRAELTALLQLVRQRNRQ